MNSLFCRQPQFNWPGKGTPSIYLELGDISLSYSITSPGTDGSYTGDVSLPTASGGIVHGTDILYATSASRDYVFVINGLILTAVFGNPQIIEGEVYGLHSGSSNSVTDHNGSGSGTWNTLNATAEAIDPIPVSSNIITPRMTFGGLFIDHAKCTNEAVAIGAKFTVGRVEILSGWTRDDGIVSGSSYLPRVYVPPDHYSSYIDQIEESKMIKIKSVSNYIDRPGYAKFGGRPGSKFPFAIYPEQTA